MTVSQRLESLLPPELLLQTAITREQLLQKPPESFLVTALIVVPKERLRKHPN